MSRPVVVMCCECRRIKRPGLLWGWRWVQAEPSAEEDVSHGYCPECYAEVMRRMDEEGEL